MTFDPTARFEKFDNKVDSALEHIRDYKFVKIIFSIASARHKALVPSQSTNHQRRRAVCVAHTPHI